MKIIILSIVLLGLIVLNTHAQDLEDTVFLKEVIILGQVTPQKSYMMNKISQDKLKLAPVHDIGEYLRTVPNVSGIRKGGSAVDPVVRGFKFSQVNVILDGGIKIENGCPNRMDPVSSHVEAEDIQRIEIIKGPFSLRYGPSFGGIVNLITSMPRPYTSFEVHSKLLYGYESNWNGNRTQLNVSGGNKKLAFNIAGGYKNFGNYSSGGYGGESVEYKTAFTRYNYSAEFSYYPKLNHALIFSYNENHGRDVRYPALPMDEVSDDTRIISVDYKVRNLTSKVASLDVKIYNSDVYHVMDNRYRLPQYDTNQMVAKVDAVNTGGRAELSYALGKSILYTGIDYEHIYKNGKRTMNMQMPSMGTTSFKQTNLWYDAKIQNTGVFAEYQLPYKSYKFQAAVRADFNSAKSGDTLKIIKIGIDYFNKTSSSFINLSGSLGITRIITSDLSVSLAVGRGTRSPNMLERYIKLLAVGYDKYDYLGNPQLKPESNNEADLTFTWINEKWGSIYLNGFYSYIQDYITGVYLPPSVIKSQTAGVLGVKQFVNASSASFRGFEFSYNTPDKNKFGAGIIAAYTYGVIPEVTKYIITGGAVVGDTLLKNDALSEVPPFETTLNIYYKFLNNKLMPKFTARIVADQNHVSEAFYEQKTPGFVILDLAVKYELLKYGFITVGVNNLLDQSYYEHLNRKMLGTTNNLYEPGRIIFVTLLLHI